MKKILIALLILFLLVDAVLAFLFFNPGNKATSLLNMIPKNCKVVDSQYCKKVTLVGNEKLNETVIAFFNLTKGSKVYSPVNGTLSFERINPGNLPYHYVKGDDGVIYFFVFEPESQPSKKIVREGEAIGTAVGSPIAVMKNHTLGVSTVKDMRFDRMSFYALFDNKK